MGAPGLGREVEGPSFAWHWFSASRTGCTWAWHPPGTPEQRIAAAESGLLCAASSQAPPHPATDHILLSVASLAAMQVPRPRNKCWTFLPCLVHLACAPSCCSWFPALPPALTLRSWWGRTGHVGLDRESVVLGHRCPSFPMLTVHRDESDQGLKETGRETEAETGHWEAGRL